VDPPSHLTRDDWAISAGLAAVIALAWAWTLAGGQWAMPPARMDPSEMARAAASVADWSLAHAVMVGLMWWVMMLAMMLPSASPFILVAAAIYRRQTTESGGRGRLALAITAGYLAVWGLFSIVAAGVELAATQGLDVPSVSGAIAGALLASAGVYQLTPLKRACLGECRSPAHFIAANWRPGTAGAFRLGLKHGAVCLGCCWLLMCLLFLGGMLNPVWIGGLAAIVLIEKVVPRGEGFSRLVGLALTGLGAVHLAAAWPPAG
jgi:predicted metal-binding membrane protein